MLAFFILSCSALKISDPAALRSFESENQTLQAWCVGVGCVQPFTPGSCLSWCDWNVDKQADAEARGAFAGKGWGKQTKAIDFGFIWRDATTCGGTEKTYHFSKNGNPFKAKDWIFPGGDAETKLETTEIQCNKCFLVSEAGADKIFIKLTRDGANNKLSQWDYNDAWKGGAAASCTGGTTNDFTLATALSSVTGSAATARNNNAAGAAVAKCIGLKGLIWPKACPVAAVAAPAVTPAAWLNTFDTFTRAHCPGHTELTGTALVANAGELDPAFIGRCETACVDSRSTGAVPKPNCAGFVLSNNPLPGLNTCTGFTNCRTACDDGAPALVDRTGGADTCSASTALGGTDSRNFYNRKFTPR